MYGRKDLWLDEKDRRRERDGWTYGLIPCIDNRQMDVLKMIFNLKKQETNICKFN